MKIWIKYRSTYSYSRKTAKKFAYNSINGGFANIEDDVYKMLKEKDIISLSKRHPDIFKNLKDTLFLVNSGLNETEYAKYSHWKAKLNQGVLGLTIAPTLDCNFACFYCYEHNVRKPSFMLKETVNDLVSFINKQTKANKTKQIYVSWYGGEPLLAFDTIKEISERLLTSFKDEKDKIDYRASVITNGYLLSEKVASALKEYKVETIQVTLDGPREIHNKRRPHRNFGGTFDVILNNILHNAKFFKRILISINVDKTNSKYIGSFLEELSEITKEHPNIFPYISPVSTENLINAPFDLQYYNSNEFANIKMDIAKKINGEIIYYPKVMYGSCGAVKPNSFVIDPEGYIYKCWNEIGSKEKSVGHVNTGITNFKRYLKWVNFDPTEIKECINCPILPLCMGGCPYRVLFSKECGSDRTCSELKENLVDYLRLWVDKKRKD